MASSIECNPLLFYLSVQWLYNGRWPPAVFEADHWHKHRSRYEVLVSSDVHKDAKRMRDLAVRSFVSDNETAVLFMDSIGAVGYDMSCVRRIIALEPVHEPDAWRQLLSRARRMGADVNRVIRVNTLVYEGSAEDSMLTEQCQHAWLTLECNA